MKKMHSLNLPLYDALRKYAGSLPVCFHMPGHKMGKGVPQEFLRDLTAIDLTEIPGTDNLHNPSGVIKDAQEAAAAAFGADRTYFLVNGSTCGIHAMIMALCKPGDKIIAGRDCHKSLVDAMILGGIRPVYVKPEYNARFGIPGALNPDAVEKALKEHPDAKCVFITRPNYYGICSDIEQIAEIAHAKGKLLAVDEAHGAHLAFNRALPASALKSGADICVQSAHKTLTALTQGAYLHVRSEKVDLDRLEFYLSMLQTSSPSYVIMAYLDIARGIMQEYGEQYLNELLDNIKWFENGLKELNKFLLLGKEDICHGSMDRTRLVINCRNLGISGFKLDHLLRRRYNIQVEMPDIYNIVCITTTADKRADFEKLLEALHKIHVSYASGCPEVLPDTGAADIEIPTRVIELWDIAGLEGCRVNINDSAGMVSRRSIIPYPPGIPVVCPGELITQEIVDCIRLTASLGGSVTGLDEDMTVDVAKLS